MLQKYIHIKCYLYVHKKFERVRLILLFDDFQNISVSLIRYWILLRTSSYEKSIFLYSTFWWWCCCLNNVSTLDFVNVKSMLRIFWKYFLYRLSASIYFLLFMNEKNFLMMVKNKFIDAIKRCLKSCDNEKKHILKIAGA